MWAGNSSSTKDIWRVGIPSALQHAVTQRQPTFAATSQQRHPPVMSVAWRLAPDVPHVGEAPTHLLASSMSSCEAHVVLEPPCEGLQLPADVLQSFLWPLRMSPYPLAGNPSSSAGGCVSTPPAAFVGVYVSAGRQHEARVVLEPSSCHLCGWTPLALIVGVCVCESIHAKAPAAGRRVLTPPVASVGVGAPACKGYTSQRMRPAAFPGVGVC
ncbi:hypothetical protein GALMADRAFT_138600 [Galerina marginata CBS 339.88]|uniref:Uncharacterized protein n=1 Tax=Galerina marginata (strain CBS 339.88) TaxID=685588 RepID=A0A067TEW9_GALM3|nr:hypothetical protein GALMADRAFT_138600 [Galerina marginata CBS 339.88]